MQIAGLSLWLRAQRSWQAQGVKPQDRPHIQRSNIVCAEPMPGDKALLEEFLASLREDRLERLIRRVLDVPAGQQVRATQRMSGALCDLVRLVWQEMTLAGEAGSLLKIEETLANAVRAAEAEWSERMPLFRVVEFGLTGDADRVRYPRTVPGEDGADFWQRAEALVLAALQDYAEQAQNGAGYQRRLFAADAARGFAFVDTCRKRYDVVLMNPPFGELCEVGGAKVESMYSTVTGNMLCAFIESFGHRIAPEGLMGSVVDRTVLIKNSYETFRTEQLLRDEQLSAVIELGWNVLDANVEVAGICVTHNSASKVGTVFGANVTLKPDKADALLECCSSPSFMDIGAFRRMPFATVNFEVPSFFLRSLQSMPALSERFGSFYNGHTIKSDVFKRLVWEVPLANKIMTWQRMWNGSDYSPFYVPMQEVVLAGGTSAYFVNHPSTIIRSPDKHLRAGLCYGKRGDYLDVQVLPSGFVLTNEGFGGPFDATVEAWFVLALLNSRVVQYMINLYCGQHKGVGYVGQLPFPKASKEQLRAVGQHAFDLYSMIQIASKSQETDPNFINCFFADTIGLRKAEIFRGMRDALLAEYERLDEAAFDLYGVSPEERIIVLRDTASRPIAPLVLDCSDCDPAGIDIFVTSNLLSYLAGCAFGRWDIRCATGDSTSSELHDPFAPLPTCPPGMLQNAHGLPAAPADVPADYPLRISWPGILVDDPGHPEDIEARVRDALRVIWPGGSRQTAVGSRQRAEGSGSELPTASRQLPTPSELPTANRLLPTSDAIEQEACQILGVSSLRDYFANPSRFFDDHLKRYSKSRRVAPIYWPLSTPSGSYTLWLYYHRLSDQILYSCVNDFVEPKLAECRGQLAEGSRQRAAGRKTGSGSRELEMEMERLSGMEAELREFRDELLRVAAFWKPNLNDGVQITAAPLWRLFQHRQWRQRLKETWEQLEAGEYDWAHLAMSTWPARVVPKCVTDRSLAIAHDVEDVFWVEDAGGWRSLRSPAEEIEAQKARQRSPAREQLRVLLGELAMGRARGLRCDEVVEQLASGQWDDLEVALLLWPERVAEKCWDDPLLAVMLKVNLPTKRTKAARERFVKERVEAGCPDLAAALVEALRERPDRFSAFWSELSRGDHDDLSLALALWPDRVVDKCAVDVELVERHGLRWFLWVQSGDGVWRRRKLVQQEVANEVARRQDSHAG